MLKAIPIALELLMVAILTIATFFFGCSERSFTEEQVKEVCNNYSKNDLDYFSELAFGSEFGSNKTINNKWESDIKIKFFGNPKYDSDKKTAILAINKIDSIMKDINVSIVDSDDYNLKFAFVSYFDLDSLYPGEIQSANGHIIPARFSIRAFNGRIKSAEIVFLNETRKERRYRLIWEELIQVMGLMNDSPSYPSSIFYDCILKSCLEGKVPPLDLDFKMLDLLYNYDLPYGLKKHEYQQLIDICYD